NVPFAQTGDTAAAFGRVRAAVEAQDRTRPMVLSAAQVVCCGRDEAEIKRRADAIGRDVDELRENGLCGTPAEVLEKIGQFGEIGAECLYLQVLDLNDLNHLELIAFEVLNKL
ncbi:LLM class F420-dependent oxidoreductase, partial [Spirillospora sp. NPDC049652]